MTVGQGVLLAALVAAAVLGFWYRRGSGRLRPTGQDGGVTAHDSAGPGRSGASADREGSAGSGGSAPGGETFPVDRVGAELGARATFVQFSSAFCAPCRATRVVLADIARHEPGVTHVEVDAESHLDLVRRFGVLRTPTVLVLDTAGRIVRRASGAPRRADVLETLRQLTSASAARLDPS